MTPTCPRFAVTAMTEVEVYKIGSEAVITLHPNTGYVSVACPWHEELNGCHYWNHRGDESLHSFLLGLDRSYAMGKLFARRSLEEYDDDATKARLKRHIIECRRCGDMDSGAARDLWDAVEASDCAHDIANLSGIDCPYEFITYKDKHCVAWFWDQVWGSFIHHLRLER